MKLRYFLRVNVNRASVKTEDQNREENINRIAKYRSLICHTEHDEWAIFSNQ